MMIFFSLFRECLHGNILQPSFDRVEPYQVT